MADISKITHSTTPPIYDDPETPQSLQGETSRPTLLRFGDILLRSIIEAVVGVTKAAKWLRRHLFLSAFILYGILISLIAGVTKRYYNKDIQFGDQGIPSGQNGTALVGHAYKVDFTSQTLSIKWDLVGCGEYLLPTYPLSNYLFMGCDCINTAVDVYFNGASKPTFSYDPASFPVQPPDASGNTDVPCCGPRYVNTLNVFNVDHSLDSLAWDKVPFDSYSFQAFAFVIEKATNKSVPIITFAAGEGPNGFIVSYTEEAVTSTYTYDSGTGPTTVEVPSRIALITIKRSRLALAFTLCLLLVDSGLAVGSAYVMLLVFFRRDALDSTVLLLPVTIVLTIPTLRGLYPNQS